MRVVISARHYSEVPATAWFWPHFTPKELACRATGRLVIDAAFLDRLEALRAAVGHPLIITSGYRTPEHNRQVSTTGDDGPHTQGQAADVAIDGAQAWALVQHAMALGFTGIGVNQKGVGRYVHVDDLTAPLFPRPRIWSY